MNNSYLSMHSICVAQCGTFDWKLETYHSNFTKYSQSSQSSAFNLKLKNFGNKFHIKLHMHLCWTDRIHRNNFFCRNGERFFRLHGISLCTLCEVGKREENHLTSSFWRKTSYWLWRMFHWKLRCSASLGKIKPHLNIWEIFLSAKW